MKAEQLVFPDTMEFLRTAGAADAFLSDIGIEKQAADLPKEIAEHTITSLGELFASASENWIRLRSLGTEIGFPRVIHFVQQRNGLLLQEALRADLQQHHDAVRSAQSGQNSVDFQLAVSAQSPEMARQLSEWYRSVAAMIQDRQKLLPAVQGLLAGPVEKSASYHHNFDGGRFLNIGGFAPIGQKVKQMNPVWYCYGTNDDDLITLSIGPAQEALVQKEMHSYATRPDAPKFGAKNAVEYAIGYFKRIADEYAGATSLREEVQ